jgi:glycerol kinase
VLKCPRRNVFPGALVLKSYISAIDQGTSSTRFMVFDKNARVVALAQAEHEQIFPRPGWVEHDALEILRRTREVIAEGLAQRSLLAADLAAIGITNQRETTVVWDRKTGEPIANAIVWQDTRVSEDVARFAAEGGQDRFRARTGLPLSTYFSALKIRWLLANVPGAHEKAGAGDLLFGNIDTFLVWNLTGATAGGEHVTDVTNASRTQLFNLQSLDWDPELLTAFDIPRAMMPRVRSSS